MPYKVPFNVEAAEDGFWEIFHDDDCGEILCSETVPYNRFCPKCKFFVDLQSLGARPTSKNERIA